MESKDALMITHYQNLLGLCQEQLEAVHLGQHERLDAILYQKDMIAGQIDKLLDTDTASRKYSREIGGQLRKLIYEMMSLEEECQKYMSEQLEAINKEYKSLRQENQFAGKYGGFTETSILFDQKK